jgi:hypothetical protein
VNTGASDGVAIALNTSSVWRRTSPAVPSLM